MKVSPTTSGAALPAATASMLISKNKEGTSRQRRIQSSFHGAASTGFANATATMVPDGTLSGVTSTPISWSRFESRRPLQSNPVLVNGLEAADRTCVDHVWLVRQSEEPCSPSFVAT